MTGLMSAAALADTIVKQHAQQRFEFTDTVGKLLCIGNFGFGASGDAAMFQHTQIRVACFNDAAGYTDNGCTCRHRMHDDGPRADFHIIAQRDTAENRSSRTHYHSIAERWMAFPAHVPGAAQSYALVQEHIVADFRRFTDNNAKTMINEEAFTDHCAGVDFDAGEKTRKL
jgi:hypothetical protein